MFNGLITQDYVPIPLTAIHWHQEALSQLLSTLLLKGNAEHPRNFIAICIYYRTCIEHAYFV